MKSIGMAKINMTAHVTALMPEASLSTPAIMPPIMPPTSNSVDRSALSEASKDAAKTKRKNRLLNVFNYFNKIYTGSIDVSRQPEEKSVVDEFGKKEAKGELDNPLKYNYIKLRNLKIRLKIKGGSTGMRRACRKPMAFSRRW